METIPAIKARRAEQSMTRPDWLAPIIGLLANLVALPFLAPVFMHLGWERMARAIYLLYGFLCHQMAQRSFFLFGPRGFQMYNLADLPVAAEAQTGNTVLVMRRFVGNPGIGWKVAWSDRMVYMYGATLLVAIAYMFARRRGQIKPLRVWVFAVLLLPMPLDGGTHMLSDMTSITEGFRYTNAWLAGPTGHALPDWFYVGDAFGSFNSWMRLFSGITFGIAIGGLLFPWLDLTTRTSVSQRQLSEKG